MHLIIRTLAAATLATFGSVAVAENVSFYNVQVCNQWETVTIPDASGRRPKSFKACSTYTPAMQTISIPSVQSLQKIVNNQELVIADLLRRLEALEAERTPQ